jgi:hypothetical protein
VAGLADRRGLRRLADFLRRFLPIARVEATLGTLFRASFRFAITDVGGCAVDIDNEHDYDSARARFLEWREGQASRARAIGGAAALPELERSAGGGRT